MTPPKTRSTVEDVPVYVIDDDEALLESLQFLLETYRIRSEHFTDPFSFLQKLRSLQPGCVLTDLRMPSMNGLELHRAVRAQKVEWPVVLMSAHLDPGTRAMAAKDEIFDVVDKPFVADRLIAIILRAFAHLEDPGSAAAPA